MGEISVVMFATWMDVVLRTTAMSAAMSVIATVDPSNI